MLNLSKGFQCMYILNILVSKFTSSSCYFKINFTLIFNKEGIIMKVSYLLSLLCFTVQDTQ